MTNLLQSENLFFYMLGAELFLLIVLQLWNNRLLGKSLKLRAQKKEALRQVKEEVKNGSCDIPVVKFEKQKNKPEGTEKKEKPQGSFDAKEMEVLQEMMTEFFG